jgi:RNA polymerase sigma factor (sigma-70 family)
MLSDLQHLQRYATTGDAHAFRELVQAHGAMVHATALRVTRDAAAAQDVAQETFLELARKAGGITQSVAAWLHRVAWNRACDAVRRETTRKRVEDAMAETWHTDREATWPDIEPHVDEALNELPQDLREVLVLYFLEGRTQTEIARHLDRNQATVSRAIERGISAMRESLRTRGVIAGAGLAAVFAAQPAQAMPATLTASLGKLSISGVGLPAKATASSSTLFSITLLTMTTTTKIFLGSTAVAAIAFVMAPQPEAKKPAAAAPVPVAKPTREVAVANMSEPKRYRPPPTSAEVRRKADDIIRRFGHRPLEELGDEAEIQDIQKRFAALMSHPDTQRHLEERLATLKAVAGVNHGTIQMEDKSLDTPFSRALIEAALADDRQLAEDVLLNRLDGAIFEFGFDPEKRKSSDGVIITPSSKPTKSAGVDD